MSGRFVRCIEEGFKVGLDRLLFFRVTVEAFQIGEKRGNAFLECSEDVRKDKGLESWSGGKIKGKTSGNGCTGILRGEGLEESKCLRSIGC